MSREVSVLARLETFLPAIHRYQSAIQAGKRPEPADARAQDDFLDALRTLLMGFARRYLRDFDSVTRDTFVQDLVSTVLLALPEAQPTPSDPPLGAWLWAVTRHAAANLRRRRRRQLKSRPLSNTIPACNESPQERLLRQEKIRLVQQALARLQTALTERDYQVLMLREIEGLSVSDVAQKLKLRPKQVHDHHWLAVKACRQLLGDLR